MLLSDVDCALGVTCTTHTGRSPGQNMCEIALFTMWFRRFHCLAAALSAAMLEMAPTSVRRSLGSPPPIA